MSAGPIATLLGDDHARLDALLARHNALEEGADGVYAACERLAGDDVATLVSALESAPDVRVSAHVDSELAMDAVRRALARAGYSLDAFDD